MFKTIRKAVLKWQIQGYTNRKQRIQGRMHIYTHEVLQVSDKIDVLRYKLKRLG